MDLRLAGKVALVAGSSRGIGKAIAAGFLAEGARVVVTGRDRGRLDAATAELAAARSGGEMLAVSEDLTTDSGIATAIDRTIDCWGRLDVVVANVGSGAFPRGLEAAARDWQTAVSVNLLGSVALAQAAVPVIAKSGGGAIVFIASIAGLEAIDAPVPYSAAKAALVGAAKAYARLCGPLGIRVNVIAPGNVLSPGGTWARKLAEREADVQRYIGAEVPLRRLGTPEEIADVALFLASDRAAFVTGACVVVDGGQTRGFA